MVEQFNYTEANRTQTNLQYAKRFVIGMQSEKVGNVLDVEQRQTARQRLYLLAIQRC